MPVVVHQRSEESVSTIGTNQMLEWRHDSSMIVVGVSDLEDSAVSCTSLMRSSGNYVSIQSIQINIQLLLFYIDLVCFI